MELSLNSLLVIIINFDLWYGFKIDCNQEAVRGVRPLRLQLKFHLAMITSCDIKLASLVIRAHVGKNKKNLGKKFPLAVLEPSTSGVALRDWTVRSKEKLD